MIWLVVLWFAAGAFLGSICTGMILQHVNRPPAEGPHRIEGTGILIESDPAHHGNHCA